MKIAAVLPHLEIYGGVRRYLELGNELVKRGHVFTIFHRDGSKPKWLNFEGLTKPFTQLNEETFNVGLCSEYSILSHFKRLSSKVKFFYFVLEGHKLERKVAKERFLFLGNSEGICRRLEKKYKIRCFRASGGINPELFYPLKSERKKDEFRVLCYGRIYKKRKGVQCVLRAVESLYKKYSSLKLIFFDSLVGEGRRDPRLMIQTCVPQEFYLDLPQSKMAWLYSQADAFVSAERRAGWSNTTAEAMACRIPVVCTRSGTSDFAIHNQTALVVPFSHPFLLRAQIKRLIEDNELRFRLAQKGYEKIQAFSWAALAEKLERIFGSVLKLK